MVLIKGEVKATKVIPSLFQAKAVEFWRLAVFLGDFSKKIGFFRRKNEKQTGSSQFIGEEPVKEAIS